MYPELIHQMVLERTARFQRDADRYRQAREAHIRPPQAASSVSWTRSSASCTEPSSR